MNYINSYLYNFSPYESSQENTLLENNRIIKTLNNQINKFSNNRIIKSLNVDDKYAVMRFSEWLKNKKEWWVLIERKGYVGKRYFKRDFWFFRVYNRFDKPYVSKTIKKFESVKFFAENKSFVHIVLTLERKQSIKKSIVLLHKNWNRLRALLKKKLKVNYPFVAVLEAHKDGYPHLHILLFTNKFPIKHETLSVWCESHGLGKVVWLKRYWANYRKKPIYYLIKYLSKQYKKESWSDAEFVFYACLWDLKAKSYTFSRFFVFKAKISEKRFKLVCIGSFSEILRFLNVMSHLYIFDYPLPYFLKDKKRRIVWWCGID
jgi:hypothetical protein